MKKRSLLIGLFVLLGCFVPFNFSEGHVGSPGVVYEGKAGPYNLLVNVNPPEVIPGTAQVQIFVENGRPDAIVIRPIYWYAGDEGSPAPDPAFEVEGVPGQWEGIIWLMSSGTASLELTVSGPEGEGTALIPIMAVSTAQNEMEPSLGWILAGLGLLLVILLSTIIGASVSDGLRSPDANPDKSLQRKRLKGMTVAFGFIALILYGGATWWDSWAENYRKFMYKPYQADSEVMLKDSTTVMQLKIDSAYQEYRDNYLPVSYLIPDHGKIMHMFVMKEGSLDGFAHLHPKRRDSLTFETNWPPLPKGKYFVFADVVRMNGFQETIADTLVVEHSVPDSLWQPLDPDDTYILTNPVSSDANELLPNDVIVCGKPGVRTPLPDGSTASWQYDSSEPLIAGQLYPMTFEITNPDGQPAELEPYMGMMGHMVVMKHDGSVYIHLHPVGSYSSASQEVLYNRIEEDELAQLSYSPVQFMDSIDAEVNRIAAMSEEERNDMLMELMGHDPYEEDPEHEGHSVVTFPYVFPEPGEYRIWIQMKRNGKVLNTAFDATVEGGDGAL